MPSTIVRLTESGHLTVNVELFAYLFSNIQKLARASGRRQSDRQYLFELYRKSELSTMGEKKEEKRFLDDDENQTPDVQGNT